MEIGEVYRTRLVPGDRALTGVGFWYKPMPSHVTFVVRVGAGVVWRRVGTLASPWVEGRLVCMQCGGMQGDASVPTPPYTTSLPDTFIEVAR